MLTRISFVISEKNIGVIWNGLGCVDDVLQKTALSPMSYRVLFPLLLKVIPKEFRLICYFFLHFLGIFLVLLTCNYFFGLQTSMILSLLIPFTIRYDYWDWIPELGAIISCASGNVFAAVIWTLAASTSRETSLALPVVWATSGHDPKISILLLIIVFSVMYMVRKWQGKKEKYCESIMIDRNGKELKEWLKFSLPPIKLSKETWQNPLLQIYKFKSIFDDMSITVLLTIASMFAISHFGLFYSIPIMMFLSAGWIFAISRETRVFTPILFWISLWVSSIT